MSGWLVPASFLPPFLLKGSTAYDLHKWREEEKERRTQASTKRGQVGWAGIGGKKEGKKGPCGGIGKSEYGIYKAKGVF